MFGHVYLPNVDARCVSVYDVLEDLQKLRHRFLAVLAPRGIKLRGGETAGSESSCYTTEHGCRLCLVLRPFLPSSCDGMKNGVSLL